MDPLKKVFGRFFKKEEPTPPPRGYFFIEITPFSIMWMAFVAIISIIALGILLGQFEQSTGFVSQFMDTILSMFYGDRYTRWDRRQDQI